MAWLAVDLSGCECIFSTKPERNPITNWWQIDGQYVILPSGSIEKLIGRNLSWEDEPVEI
jgi:hypothetical protein